MNNNNNKTKFGTLTLDGEVINKMEINLNEVGSDDPIAFSYGLFHGKTNYPLPEQDSENYKELASEYLRGYKLGSESVL